jgi:hypothetical protein
MNRLATCRLMYGCGVVLLSMAMVGVGAGAEVSVVDAWEQRGITSLANGECRLVFTKGDSAARVHDLAGPESGAVMSLTPFDAKRSQLTGIAACSVVSQAPDEARCEVVFSTKEAPIAAAFALDSRGTVKVRPSTGLAGLAVSADFAYAVLPSRHLDDNIYRAADYPRLAHLHVPSENVLMGLVQGGNHVVAMAWPSGGQSAQIALSGVGESRRIQALEVTLAGSEVFVGLFSAPRIWHRLELDPSTEEQDAPLAWKPPFTAAWKMQLAELGVPTTFRCVDGRKRPWRPTIGFYTYPFFVEGGKVLLHLHKKLDTTGEALIYALEGHPKTPYALLTSNLPLAEQRKITELQAVEHYYVLDPSPVEGGFLMNAHCAGRDQLQHTTLTVGAQAREIPFLDTHISDRAHECEFIITHHVQRSLDCMDALDEDIAGWMGDEAGNANVLESLRKLRETLEAMQDEYRGRLRGETPEQIIERIHDVAGKFRAVIREDAGVELCPEILARINELNAIISLEEDQGRRFGTWSRKLFQQAGYECVSEPKAAEYAERVRSRLREHLRYRQYESPRTSGTPGSLLSAE